jgi:hypothetical protein
VFNSAIEDGTTRTHGQSSFSPVVFFNRRAVHHSGPGAKSNIAEQQHGISFVAVVIGGGDRVIEHPGSIGK